MLTQQRLIELLDYNPHTGEFVWKINRKGLYAGSTAGSKCIRSGYIDLRVDYKLYGAHRLAWMYFYGEFPNGCIDHINGIRDDNRIINLRDVSNRENGQNQKMHRDGRLFGTTYDIRTNKWKARIRIGSKRNHLGSFDTEVEAHAAYLKALEELENKDLTSL